MRPFCATMIVSQLHFLGDNNWLETGVGVFRATTKLRAGNKEIEVHILVAGNESHAAAIESFGWRKCRG